MQQPLIVHCDWSTSPSKRWMATARPGAGGFWYAGSPEPVGRLETLFAKLRVQQPNGAVFAGFDFPIGLPRSYARIAGIENFQDALPIFGTGSWNQFYFPAAHPDDICLTRPFYPRIPGGTSKQELVDGLGLKDVRDLLRHCDCATMSRPKACEMFWTLGAKQVGRAAISGWRDLLSVAVNAGAVCLWPFGGDLPELFDTGLIVVAETYPGETYAHLGIAPGFGKTRRERRAEQASPILQWCLVNHVVLDPVLESAIRGGFGDSEVGEDMFDTLVGLLGMIEVVRNPEAFAAPHDPDIRNLEGWILGMRQDEPRRDSPYLRTIRPVRASERGEGATHPARPPAQSNPAASRSRLCPACLSKLFARWPLGWDAHAAHKCSAIAADTPEERKLIYKRLYLS